MDDVEEKENKHFIYSFVKNLNKNEIIASLLQWGLVDVEKILHESVSKVSIVKNLIQVVTEEQITFEEMCDLNLLCQQYVSHSKITWHTYKIQDRVKTKFNVKSYTPNNFKNTLQTELYKYGYFVVNVLEYNFSLRGRVSKANSKKALYFIHFPYSNVLLLTKISDLDVTTALFQSLENMLGCGGIYSVHMQSNDPDSLAQIALHTSSKENYTYDRGYYAAKTRPKDKSDLIMDSKLIVQENKASLQKDIKRNIQAFGSAIQPCIQDASISTKSKFENFNTEKVNMEIDANIKFQGKNVLEGLYNLHNANLADPPLPNFLTKISKFGTNQLNVQEK